MDRFVTKNQGIISLCTRRNFIKVYFSKHMPVEPAIMPVHLVIVVNVLQTKMKIGSTLERGNGELSRVNEQESDGQR
jgi:hypothetical protein